jgi:site-specific recombinase XerD
LLQVKHVDLSANTLVITGKGGKIVVMPIGFRGLRDALFLHISGEERDPEEFFIYPKSSRTRPMTPPSLHRWFKRALERAGLPPTVKLHELRHSAADALWRSSHDIVMAQMLLRHESPSTTALYLHPHRDDLAGAMKAADEAWAAADPQD